MPSYPQAKKGTLRIQRRTERLHPAFLSVAEVEKLGYLDAAGSIFPSGMLSGCARQCRTLCCMNGSVVVLLYLQ